MKTVGEHIKHFIKERYGSQKHAAKILNVPPSFLSMVIHDKRKLPRDKQLKLIKAGLDKSVFYNYLDIQNPAEIKIEDWQSYLNHLSSLILSQELMIESFENRLSWEHAHKEWLKKELHATRMELKKHTGSLPKKFTDKYNSR